MSGKEVIWLPDLRVRETEEIVPLPSALDFNPKDDYPTANVQAKKVYRYHVASNAAFSGSFESDRKLDGGQIINRIIIEAGRRMSEMRKELRAAKEAAEQAAMQSEADKKLFDEKRLKEIGDKDARVLASLLDWHINRKERTR